MGTDALCSNGITKKILYLMKDKIVTPRQDPLNKVRKSRILLFVSVQLVGFGATFATTQTIGSFFCSHLLTIYIYAVVFFQRL